MKISSQLANNFDYCSVEFGVLIDRILFSACSGVSAVNSFLNRDDLSFTRKLPAIIVVCDLIRIFTYGIKTRGTVVVATYGAHEPREYRRPGKFLDGARRAGRRA